MFAGIIEEQGKIKKISSYPKLKKIEIEASKIIQNLKLGDSVALNGVCLTVDNLSSSSFSVKAVSETLKRTNLSFLKSGERVNLERAMRLGERLGGHIVLGHIDGLARVVKKENSPNETCFWLKISPSLFSQIVPQGSVTLEGVSLTVAEIKNSLFKVAIIPYTLKETNLFLKRVGSQLNLELDYLGKYVKKIILRQIR